MSSSNALTVPITIILGLSLSTAPVANSINIAPMLSYHAESTYQTTSLNIVAKEYRNTSVDGYHDALSLFGDQRNFTPEEKMTYKTMLRENSQSAGINIFNLL